MQSQRILVGLGTLAVAAVVAVTLILPAASTASAVAVSGNDNFADAWVVDSLPFDGQQSTVGMTTEEGEPLNPHDPISPSGPRPCILVEPREMGATVWYRFAAAESGLVTVDTRDSAFDTVLAAYTGDAIDALTTLDCDDDFAGLQSEVSFSAVAGTIYHIQVGGYDGREGDLILSVSLEAGVGQSGDVNCDGSVDALDAALVLLFDAGLINSLPCPADPDVNGDGSANSIDAALILQYRAGLVDSLPPDPPTPGPPATGTLSVGSAVAELGAEATVDVTSNVADPGLGAWTVNITYDNSVITATDCSGMSFCNMGYPSDTVRITGASVLGEEGETVLSTITFECGFSEGSSDLTLDVEIFADATVGAPQPIDVTVYNGSVTCEGPTPTPTPVKPKNTSLNVDGPSNVGLGDPVNLSGSASFLQDLDGDGRAGWSEANVFIIWPAALGVAEASSISAGVKAACFKSVPSPGLWAGSCLAKPDQLSPPSLPEEIDPVSYGIQLNCAEEGTHTVTVITTFSREDGSPVPPEKATSNAASANITCSGQTPTPCPPEGCPPPPAQMSLNVKSPTGVCDDPAKPTKCVIDTGSQFTLSVGVNSLPPGGEYIGIGTDILLGDSLTYKPAASAAEEIVWPDAGGLLVSLEYPPGRVRHGGGTANTPPFPASTFTGNIVEITLNCSAIESSNTVILPAYDDDSNTFGAQFRVETTIVVPGNSVGTENLDLDGDGQLDTNDAGELIDYPIADALEVDCIPPRGDVNCDKVVNVVDALFILQYEVGLREDSGGCPLPPDTLNAAGGDVDKDGDTDVVDAMFILQCEVGVKPGANMAFCTP